MNDAEIKALIIQEVSKKIKEEKIKLAKMVEHNLSYTGEFASSTIIIDTFNDWVNS